jgi:hypothetical protein
MRFIVDLYRYIIIGLCGLAIILGAFAVIAALDVNGPLLGQYPGWVIAVAFASAVLFILSIGGLAIIVSLHDRHAELADAALELKTTLDRIADTLAYGADREHDR